MLRGFLIGLVVFAACGCAKPVSTVNISSSGRYEWIRTDSELSQKAAVVGVNKAREGDLLRVQVQVQNQSSYPAEFMYRYVWLDNNGMEVHTPLTTWQRVHIQGRQTIALNGIAPDARCADCRLEIKRPDR